MAFTDSDNKRAIRRVWDHAILASRRKLLGRGLRYFGLPGPEMHDIVDWIDLLHRDVTAIEKDGKTFFDTKSRMLDVGAAHDRNVEVLRGKVEQILKTGRSVDNERARYASFPGGRLHLAYDLINLDFIGGNTLLRHKSVEELFQAQAKTPFTLFVTYNVRTPMIKQTADELANLKVQVDTGGAEMVAWYQAHSLETMRLKAIVPPIIVKAASAAHVDCRAYPPVRYIGYGGTTLMHFAFDLSPSASGFTAVHRGIRSLMTLPLVDSVDGVLKLSDERDPDFDVKRCAAECGFLTTQEQEVLLGRL